MISKVQGGHQYTHIHTHTTNWDYGGPRAGSGNYSLVLQDNVSLLFPGLGSGT